MTYEEAAALVLEEGMRTEPVPDDCMATLLHEGTEPSDQQMNRLIKALRVIQEESKGQPLLDRNLAVTLWLLGVEASGRLGMNLRVTDLMMAVESVFFDDWFVEDRKGSGGANGDSTA